jgi:hypothetical protein
MEPYEVLFCVQVTADMAVGTRSPAPTDFQLYRDKLWKFLDEEGNIRPLARELRGVHRLELTSDELAAAAEFLDIWNEYYTPGTEWQILAIRRARVLIYEARAAGLLPVPGYKPVRLLLHRIRYLYC